MHLISINNKKMMCSLLEKPKSLVRISLHSSSMAGHYDGDVTNASAKSLKYLINGRAKSYQELMIRGRGGQHSALHNNSQVNKALIRFIW